MQSENNDSGRRRDDLLQRPLDAVLGDDESVDQVLTNTRVGVTREADDGETAIEPGREYGAVGAITDERLVFAVGSPDGAGDDFTTSLSYDAVESVDKRTETLTQSLVVETDDERWAFTARKPRAVDEAVAAIEDRLAERALAAASEHHGAAKAASDPACCATELEAALDAYRRAAELLGGERGPVSDAEREAREDAEAVIANLVASHRDHGAQSTEAAEWELAADNEESAYELYVEARAAYDRALELARAYPPGDPETIEAERGEVEAALEPLKVEFAVAEAADD
jgi:hypothetical protein